MSRTGRPSKYDPKMCDKVIELMSEGAALVEVAAELDITRETLNQWTKSNPVFSDAVKKGQELSEAWWLKQGRINLKTNPKGEQFNSTLWYMNMKNRFGWRDKHEVAGDAASPLQIVIKKTYNK